MRPIRIITPLALGLAVLAVAGCQSRSDQPTTAVPTQVERAATAATAPAQRATPPSRPPAGPASKSSSAPRPETIVGLWPARTLHQARQMQDGADAGHQPWLLSAELVSTAYAGAELGLLNPKVQQVGPAAYQVRADHGEWEATLYLAQPVRHDNGVWVVTRVGDPVS
jgi:hypothetical protein